MPKSPLRSPLRVLFLMVALIFAVQPLQSVHGFLMTATESATLNAPDTPTTDPAAKPENQGNGFIRALKAPFKAIGRLFSRGKKDNVKLERISEKDIKKFEGQTSNAAISNQVTPVQEPVSAGTSAQEHMERGRALLNAGNLNAAIAELSTAASLDPKLAEAHTLLGLAYDRKGLAERAQQSFETALHSRDDEAMHLNNLGYLEYKNGEYDKAVKYLKRAAKLAPNDQRIWNNLGLAQSELGKFRDAYKSFARVAGEFNGHLNVAIRLENHGSSDEAIKHLEKALALQPTSTVVLTQLVGLYERIGRHERADQARSALAAYTVANAAAEKNKR
jgi:Flp pilus assembly protein TadD